MMKHILIPTDFSINAWNAIEYMMAFCQKSTIHLHLVHIEFGSAASSDAHLHSNGIRLFESNTLTSQQQLDGTVDKIRMLFPKNDMTIETHVMHGFFIDGIKRAIRDFQIDMIIMGTKGASGLREATLGSLTGAVITRVKCPVFVIPEKAEFHHPENIVLPTDFNMLYKQRVLDTLFEMADKHQSNIKILRVAQQAHPLQAEQEKNRNFLLDALARRPHSFHVVTSPKLEEGLQSFIDDMNIQMVAMIAKNLNFFQRLLLKPRIQTISYHTEIPFLVLHE